MHDRQQWFELSRLRANKQRSSPSNAASLQCPPSTCKSPSDTKRRKKTPPLTPVDSNGVLVEYKFFLYLKKVSGKINTTVLVGIHSFIGEISYQGASVALQSQFGAIPKAVRKSTLASPTKARRNHKKTHVQAERRDCGHLAT